MSQIDCRRNLTMTLAVALVAGLGLSACTPQVGPGPEPMSAPPPAALAPEDRLVAAIEENGCLLTADNAAAILLRANLTQEQLLALAPTLAANGRAEVAASGAVRVLTDRCI